MSNAYDVASVNLVVEELQRARSIHEDMHSAHEGFAVLLEEVHELWDEVKAKEQSYNAMHKEAKQVAAMAIRFMSDVCERKP